MKKLENRNVPKSMRKPILNLFKLEDFIRLFIKPSIDNVTPKIVSDRYKFIYVGNPLVGSTSFRNTLVRRPKIDYAARIETFNLKENLHKYRDYFIFSLVRNPFSRVVSCYNKKILNTSALGLLRMYSKYNLNLEMSFEDFVNFLCSEMGRDEIANRHWVSQYKILLCSNGEHVCDYIGKLENLQQELQTISEYISTSIELSKDNTSTSRLVKPFYDKWQDYYSKELTEKVYWRYFEDFKRFGYRGVIKD